MKLLKRKNFQSLIYAIFISLPILSILPSTIYFAFNHEASNYTHEEVITTYEYETNEVNSVNDLVEGNIYHFEYSSSDNLTLFFGIHYVFNLETNVNITFANTGSMNTANIQPASFYVYGYNEVINQPMRMYNNNNGSNYTISFDFTYEAIQDENQAFKNNCQLVLSASNYLGEKNVDVFESEMNPISAFDNAIGKFVSENDFGQIDFFTFFSSLFLTSTSMNNLYIHFINWYLNYILYISLAYLLFSVLLWFVNFARRLLEDSQNINIGGF